MCYLSAWIDLSPMHRFVQLFPASTRVSMRHAWARTLPRTRSFHRYVAHPK